MSSGRIGRRGEEQEERKWAICLYLRGFRISSIHFSPLYSWHHLFSFLCLSYSSIIHCYQCCCEIYTHIHSTHYTSAFLSSFSTYTLRIHSHVVYLITSFRRSNKHLFRVVSFALYDAFSWSSSTASHHALGWWRRKMWRTSIVSFTYDRHNQGVTKQKLPHPACLSKYWWNWRKARARETLSCWQQHIHLFARGHGIIHTISSTWLYLFFFADVGN